MKDDDTAARLRMLAWKCEEAKRRGGCPNECTSCSLYIPLYATPKNVQDVALIKAATMAEYSDYRRDIRVGRWKALIWALMVAGAVLWFMAKCSPGTGAPPADTNIMTRVAEARKKASDKVWDVNEDGLVNCIDHAILFALAYPESAIVRNLDPRKGGMNHLFNAVPDGKGGWIFVEPWVSNGGPLMTDAWGKRYNPKYNSFETKRWLDAIPTYDYDQKTLDLLKMARAGR